jgi:RNA-directed DNA polymerase
MMAQAMRAILLASATAATLVGRRSINRASHGRVLVLRLMYSMMVLARANEESEIKSHRGAAVWDTRRKKARASLTVFRAGNKPPWLDFDNEKSVWIVNKQRAKIVKRIIDDRIAGKSRRTIAKELNTEGVKTWHPDRKDGAMAWSGTYVDKILRSRSLIGEYQPYLRPCGSKGAPIGDPIPGFYPVVIKEKRWFAAQAVRNEGVNFRGRRCQFRNILRGLTQCACGSRTEFIDTGQYTYLRCTAAWHRGCDHKRMHSYKRLEIQTLAALGTRAGSIVSGDPEFVRNLETDFAGNRALLADLKSRRDNLIELAETDGGASVAGRLFEIEAHISAAQKTAEALQKSIAVAGEASSANTTTLTEAWQRLSEASSPDERSAINSRLRRLLVVEFRHLVPCFRLWTGKMPELAMSAIPPIASFRSAEKQYRSDGRTVVAYDRRNHLSDMTILAQLASDAVLDSAYQWLCRRRRDYSANSDMWSFRRCWQREKEHIKDQLRSGNYRFSLLSRITLKTGDDTELWSARDALVLKALTIVLAKHLPVSHRCTHLKGNGGAKYAVREVSDHLPDNRFVLRTDVKSYYASIGHLMLLDQLAVHINDKRVLNLLGQYLRRTSESGGVFRDYEKGISLGCPLSPLIGAFFLNALDAAAHKLRLFYVRFMDDILILAPTHWQLRRAVKAVNQSLGALSLEKHPDKTFIGKIERGFDFLGYHFNPKGLAVTKKTLASFIEKASRLYEQERRQISSVFSVSPLEMYVRRWLRWSTSGVDGRVAQADILKGCGKSGRLFWSGALSVGASELERRLQSSPPSA